MTIIMTKHDLHLDFCVFFSNQQFARKYKYKGSKQEDYE